MKLLKTFTLIASLSAGLAATAVPANAQGAAAAAGTAAAASNGEHKAKVASTKTKYCVIMEAATGSRLSQRECKTKKQWSAQGVDVETLK